MTNVTITVPDGTINHGDPSLLCFPPKWYDYIIFYLGNYVTHIATILSIPGEETEVKIFAAISALIFPTTGTARALRYFILRPMFVRDPLNRAARAGALCMVLDKRDVDRLESFGDRRDVEAIEAQMMELQESQ